MTLLTSDAIPASHHGYSPIQQQEVSLDRQTKEVKNVAFVKGA